MSGDVVAQSVTLMLPNGLLLEPDLSLDASQAIGLSGFTTIEDGITTATAPPDHATLRAGGTAEFAELALARGATVTLALQRSKHRQLLQLLAFDGATFRISLTDPGPSPDPRMVSAVANDHSAVPMRLEALLGATGTVDPALWAGQLVVTDIAAANLRFAQEDPRQPDSSFVSSITGGHVTLVGIGKTIALDPAAPVVLAGFRGTVLRLLLAEDGFHIMFGGSVDRLKIGPPGFPSDQTPSMLEVLFHDQSVQFAVSALAWAFAWLAPMIYLTRKPA